MMENKFQSYHIRLTTELHQKIKTHRGLFPKIIRKILTDDTHLDIIKHNDILLDILIDLRGSGNNINQMVRRLHQQPDNRQNKQLIKEFTEVVKIQSELIKQLRLKILQ